MSSLYPRTISVHRAVTSDDGGIIKTGVLAYQGVSENTDPTQWGGENVLMTGVPCSIQARAMGKTTSQDKLPSDSPGPPVWYVYIPSSSVAKGLIRDRDTLVDDEGYRYMVGSAYWNLMGYRLNTIRLEA